LVAKDRTVGVSEEYLRSNQETGGPLDKMNSESG